MILNIVSTFHKVARVIFITITFILFCLKNRKISLLSFFLNSVRDSFYRYLGETKGVYLFLWPSSDYTKFNFDQTNADLLKVVKDNRWFKNTSLFQMLSLTMVKRLSIYYSSDFLGEFEDQPEYNLVSLDYDLMMYGWGREFSKEEEIGSFIFNRIPISTISNDIFCNQKIIRKKIRKKILHELTKENHADIIYIYIILFSLCTKQRTPGIFAINRLEKRMKLPNGLERLRNIFADKPVKEYIKTSVGQMALCSQFTSEEIESEITFYSKQKVFNYKSLIRLPVRSLYLGNNLILAGTSANHLFVDSKFTPTTMPFPQNQLIFSRNRVLATNDSCYWSISGKPEVVIEDAVILPGISRNYFHFLFDSLGPLALLDNQKIPENVVIGGTKNLLSFQKEILEILNIKFENYVCSDDFNGKYLIRKGYFCDNPSYLNVISPGMIDFLRKKMIPYPKENPTRKIYFTRIDYQRSFQGKEYFLFCDYLKDKGFEIIDSGRLKVREQIDIVQSAGVLVVDAGAAASNLVFLNKNSRCILFASDFGYRETFTPIVQKVGFKHSVVLFETKAVFPHAFHLWSDLIPEFDFELAKKAVEANI